MNEKTINKLKKNPHYRMSESQVAEIGKADRAQMVEFGQPPIHDNHVVTHQAVPTRRRRRSR